MLYTDTLSIYQSPSELVLVCTNCSIVEGTQGTYMTHPCVDDDHVTVYISFMCANELTDRRNKSIVDALDGHF